MNSPIETMLYRAILEAREPTWQVDDFTHAKGVTMTVSNGLVLPPCHEAEPSGVELDDPHVWIELFSSVKILTYRLDFLVVGDANGGHGYFAIECDGHDYHDRTKQQAAYDRARDRELLRLGIPTLRFTGSEIHHDAHRCAVECWQMVPVVNKREEVIQLAWSSGYDAGMIRERDKQRNRGVFAGTIGGLG